MGCSCSVEGAVKRRDVIVAEWSSERLAGEAVVGRGQQSSDRFGRSGLQMRWSSTRCCCTRFVYSHSWTFAYCTLALASARATPHITQGTTSAWTCMYVWRLQRSLQQVITRTLRRQRMGWHNATRCIEQSIPSCWLASTILYNSGYFNMNYCTVYWVTLMVGSVGPTTITRSYN